MNKLTKLIDIYDSTRRVNLESIINGEDFEKLFKETRSKANDFVVSEMYHDESAKLDFNSEKNLFLFSSISLMINIEFGIDTNTENPYKRLVTIHDTLNNVVLDLYIYDYSIIDLINNIKISKYSLNKIKNGIINIYTLRSKNENEIDENSSPDDKITFRRYSLNDNNDIEELDVNFKNLNIDLDPYKYDEEHDEEDNLYLEDYYDQDGNNVIESKWESTLSRLYNEYYEDVIIDYYTEKREELLNGVNFDEMYSYLITKFREMENKVQPTNKKSRETPQNLFYYLCDNFFNIDIGLMKINNYIPYKNLGSNKENILVYDILKNNGKTVSGIKDIIDDVHSVNFTDTQVLYNSIKKIYSFRNNN